MKSDHRNGCSTCQPGEELIKEYHSSIQRCWLYQYEYRTPDGELYACVARSPEQARIRRDKWLAERQAG